MGFRRSLFGAVAAFFILLCGLASPAYAQTGAPASACPALIKGGANNDPSAAETGMRAWIVGLATAPAAFVGVPMPAEIGTSYACFVESFTASDKCWGCELFVVMANVVDTLGTNSQTKYKDALLGMLSAFFGAWVMFQFVKVLMSVTGSTDGLSLIQEVVNKAFVFVILVIIAKLGTFTYLSNKFIYPFLSGCMQMGIDALETAGGSISAPGAYTCTTMTGLSNALGDFGSKGLKMMCAIHNTAGKGMALGAFMVTSAHFSLFTQEILKMIAGVLLIFAFFVLSVMVPFKLFDSLIRLAIVAVILPFMVFASLFKVTRGFVTQGLKSVAAAGFNFMFVAIAMGVAMSLLSKVMNTVNLDQVDNDTVYGPLGHIGLAQFMLLLGTAVGMSAFTSMASNLASEFSGFQGSMGGVGAAGAGAVGGAIAGAAHLGGAVAGFGVASGIVGRAAGKAAGAAVSKAIPAGKAASDTPAAA